MTTSERIADLEARIVNVDGRIQGLRVEVGSELGILRTDVKTAQAVIAQRLQSELSQLDARHASEATKLKQNSTKAIADLDREEALRKTQVGNRAKQAGLRLRDAAAEFAPHRAVIATDAINSDDLVPGTQVRELVTVGTLKTPGASTLDRDLPRVPALVPFVDAGHLIVESPSGTSDAPEAGFQALMTSLVAQTYASAPPGQMVVTVFNPRSSKVLAGFRPTGAETAGLLRVLPPTRESLEKSLEEHLVFTQRAESSIGTYASMGELVRSTGQHEHQYHVLVIIDGPIDWSAKAVDLLEKLMASGSKAGLSVLLHRDPQAPPLERVDVTRIDKYASVLSRRRGDWSLTVPGTGAQEVPIDPVAAVSPTAQGRLMQLVVAQAKDGSLPSIPFDEIVDRTPGTTEHGMSLTMGKKGTQVTEFILGDTVSNIQNVLVGGRAGSGKTNLLKVMIYSLAARYPREELELFLLDFKEGGDFMPFAGGNGFGALPNVSVVSRDCDAAFGIETLRHFAHEMARRANLTSDHNVSNIWDLRTNTGIKLPRWVLIIDEFQGLFSGPTYQEATELLEDFVRKGRSFGLHVILATQTLSGVKFAGDKDKAIFENISGRVVLQLGPGEFTRFMQSGNDEGEQLRYRGQAIFNPMGGLKSENQLFVVARADAAHTNALQEELHRTYLSSAGLEEYHPFLYRGDATVSAAQLIDENGAPTPDNGDLPAWYGRKNSIERPVAFAPLSEVSGSHLLLLGGDEKTMSVAIATLQTAILSAVAAENGALDVLVFEQLLRKHRSEAQVDEWLDTLASLGANVVRFDGDTADRFVEAVADATDARRRTLVAILGAENTDLATIAADGGRWRTLLREMPRRNVNLIGHWSDVRDIMGDTHTIREDYKTILFFGKNEQLISDTTRRARYDLPTLANNRTVVFSANSSQDGITTVTSLRPLAAEDFAAFRSLADGAPGTVTVGGIVASAVPSAVPVATTVASASGSVPVDAPAPAGSAVANQSLLSLISREQVSTAECVRAVVGVNANGPVSVTLGGASSAHLLATGRPMAGIGPLVERLMHAFAAQHAQSELRIDLIDSDEEGDFPALAPGSLPHLETVTRGANESEIRGVLEAYTAETQRRLQRFAETGSPDYRQFRARGEELPRWVLVWGSFADALTPALAAQIEWLTDVGGLVGIHIVLSGIAPVSERAVDLPKFFASSGRLLLQVTEEESRALIGGLDASKIQRRTHGIIASAQQPLLVFAAATAEDGDLDTLRARLGGDE